MALQLSIPKRPAPNRPDITPAKYTNVIRTLTTCSTNRNKDGDTYAKVFA